MKVLVADLQKLIDQQESKDGIKLSAIPVGAVVGFQTLNTYYTLKKLDHDWSVKGGNFFPEWTKCALPGCTWGGSMIKIDWLGEGMHAEFHPLEGPHDGTVTTTAIRKIYLGEEPKRIQ